MNIFILEHSIFSIFRIFKAFDSTKLHEAHRFSRLLTYGHDTLVLDHDFQARSISRVGPEEVGGGGLPPLPHFISQQKLPARPIQGGGGYMKNCSKLNQSTCNIKKSLWYPPPLTPTPTLGF